MLIILKISLHIFIFYNSYKWILATDEQCDKKRTDLYSSVASLENVLKVENIFIKNLENFIQKSELDIKTLRRLIRDYKKGIGTKSQLKCIQRFKNIEENVNKYLQKFNNTCTIYNSHIPIVSDLDGAIIGLVRLQEIYGYTADQIANGNLSDLIKLPAKFTSHDCFKIGQRLNELKIYNFAADWYRAALERSNKKESKIFKTFQDLDDKSNLNIPNQLGYDHLEILQNACRGKLKKNSTELRKLYCKYETENHPFLKLAPIKIEILNLEPYLILLYDTIYDSEITLLKQLSITSLERAFVWNDEARTYISSNYRVSKHAWISDDQHPVMQTINQRLHDMSGLTMETSEDLQIANYGIGGHYDFHVDYASKYMDLEFYEKEWGIHGDRIATILFYLSDVPIGGATVWPFLNVTVNPVKGNAVFWYNLHSNLEGNINTLHSSCPVVLGSKWAANKWIRTEGQLFRRPCLANSQTINTK